MSFINSLTQPLSQGAVSSNSPVNISSPTIRGRTYKKLGRLERLNKLREFISILFKKLFTLGIYKGQLLKTWQEFKSGKIEIKSIVLDPAKNSSENPSLNTDPKKVDDIRNKTNLDPNDSGKSKTNKDEPNEDDNFNEDEDVINKDGPNNKPLSPLGKPESPKNNSDLNGNSQKRNPDSKGDSPKSNPDSNGESPKSNPDSNGESPKSNTDSNGDSPKSNADSNADSPKSNPDSNVDSSTNNPTITKLDDAGEEEEPKDAPSELEVDPVDAINHPDVASWLNASEDDAFLSQTDFYLTLRELHDAVNNGKDKTQAEERDLEQKFLKFKDKILAIGSSLDNFKKVTELERDEFAFNQLKSQFKDINENVNLLQAFEHGSFKANMLVLLNLVSVTSSTSSKLEQPKDDAINENGVEDPIEELSESEKEFADFQNQINDIKNAKAKEAFIIFKDILKSDIDVSAEELDKYNQADAAVHKAIKNLAQPLHNLAENTLKYSEKELKIQLKIMNNIFDLLPDLDATPYFKQLFIQETEEATLIYQLLTERNEKGIKDPNLGLKIDAAKTHMENFLDATNKMKLTFAIKLGKEILLNPAKGFNHYLDINHGLQFTKKPPSNSKKIEKFLENMHKILDERNLSAEDLLALDAFTSMTLYTYIINPKTYLDSSFQSIVDSLYNLRAKTDQKLTAKSIQSKVKALRKNKVHQAFYHFLKEHIQLTPDYPITFWKNPTAAERMKSLSPLVDQIGVKIADPTRHFNEPIQLIHKNLDIGYEIYLHRAPNEKPKLLFFVTRNKGTSTLQSMNHQLGLFGDPTLLQDAQEIMNHMTSTELLEGYIDDLKDGNIEIVAAGYDNSGSIATLVASRLALIYPKTQVTSIAAGSATSVTTEDAYNINKSENFLPIRIKYLYDNDVSRKVIVPGSDFSEDLYQTFPLLVKYNKSATDIIFKHNKEEYGNIDNFVPAMTNPLILREIYQGISDQIADTLNSEDGSSDEDTISMSISTFLKKTTATKNLHEISSELERAGRIEELINLGDEILKSKKEENKFNGVFANFDKKDNNIFTLEETIQHLKNPEIIKLLTPKKAFSLLIAVNVLLINYTKNNPNVGKLPQLVNLLTEIRQLATNRLGELISQDEKVLKLLKKIGVNDLKYLAGKASNAIEVNPDYKNILDDKDVLGKIDYEDRFLEFIGFKIAVKNQDKIGSDSYVSKLHTDSSLHYDISLFTPEDLNKKQRIVICCNGQDVLKGNTLSGSLDFGAGDSGILKRAENLKIDVMRQLKIQFKQYQFNAEDVDIVVTGFGSEGAVATALGYSLAKEKEFEDANCQVQSLGFGAPKFTNKLGGDKILKQMNFVPIRFLGAKDFSYELKFPALMEVNYELSDSTYYTIPYQYRNPGLLDKIGGFHSPNLYGDVQGIKITLKSAYLMRDVANELNKFKMSAAKGNKEKPSLKTLPTRIFIDNRKAVLTELSQKKNLKKVPPGKLIGIMKYCVELSETDSLSDDDKAVIKTFFENFIKAIKNDDIDENHDIKRKFYKRMVNHGYKPNQLFGGKWKLQQIISKDLEEAMNAVNNADKNTTDPKKIDELILARSYLRGILAGDLNGNRYKPAGGGVNGAVFFRHLESGLKKPEALLPDETKHIPFLGVFKPHPETVRDDQGNLNAQQLGEFAKKFFGMDSHLNKDDPDKRVNNEIFAYEMYHIFGFNPYIGFPATLKFKNKNDKVSRPASFCAFVPGLDLVEAHVKSVSKKHAKSNLLDDAKRKYSQSELYVWQMSKLFDFLTGNMDGHEGNAFVKVEKGRVVGAVNFDYDKAFAFEKTPKIDNQYKWASLEISKHNFTDATRKALEELFKDGKATSKIEAFLTKAREDDKLFFSQDQEKLLRERVEILKKVAAGEIKQLSDFANLK